MKNWTNALLGSLLCLGVATMLPVSVRAEHDYMPPMGNLTKAGVAPDHAKAIHEIRQKSQQEMAPLHAKLKAQRQAYMEYLSAPNATEQQAANMSSEMNQTYAKLGDMRLKSWFETRQHLTPEQMQKLKAQRQQQMANMQMGRRHHQGKHPQGSQSMGEMKMGEMKKMGMMSGKKAPEAAIKSAPAD
jgi:Spy/CpxP family protein refolding chaperone